MTRKMAVIATAAVLMGTLWTPAAFAGTDWFFGGGFQIGGVHFSIGLHGARHDLYHYRTRVDLVRYFHGRSPYARGHYGRDCYYADGWYYHARSCPLVHAYFRQHGYRADRVFARYSPRYTTRYDVRGYGGRGYSAPPGEYRRYGRYRDHGHYRDHGRYRDHRSSRRGHRHSRSCRHH
jgi:hypothetical protein